MEEVIQYDLSTPWDISSATNQVESNAFTGEEDNIRNIQFIQMEPLCI